MTRPGATGERVLALFSLGVLLFNPPLLKLFSTNAYLLGVPLLYVYLFVSWGILILLAALLAGRRGGGPPAMPERGEGDRDA